VDGEGKKHGEIAACTRALAPVGGTVAAHGVTVAAVGGIVEAPSPEARA
jgi:hypothetical protein